MIQFTYLPDIRWLISVGAGALTILVLSYYWAKGRSRRGLRIGLAVLRGVIVAAVVFCLLDPEWVEAIKRQPKSRLAFLLDTSRSMTAKDVPAGRLAAARSFLQKDVTPAGMPNVSIEYYTFNQTLTPVDRWDKVEATGEATGVADALDSLLTVPRDDPLLGVVLCSDGIENLRRDPEATARTYHRKGIPIHTVLVGTTNDMQDLIVDNVQVKRVVPNQAPAKIGVLLRSFGYQDLSVPVQILRGNQVVATQQVKLKNGTQRIDLDFVPRDKGFQVYEVNVPVQKNEWMAANNRKRFGLEVVDPNIRVIYM
jgi:hypothetical protein